MKLVADKVECFDVTITGNSPAFEPLKLGRWQQTGRLGPVRELTGDKQNKLYVWLDEEEQFHDIIANVLGGQVAFKILGGSKGIMHHIMTYAKEQHK